MKFYIFDVFARQPYQGNQLAVFFPDEPLSASAMQKIAREINFSESSFIVAFDSGSLLAETRIFTPRQEVKFAGHPVIGSACALHRNYFTGSAPRTMMLALPAGNVPLEPLDNTGTAWRVLQPPPTFGQIIATEELEIVLGLEHKAFDPELPAQIVSTGLPHLIVAVRNREFLARCQVDLKAYYRLVEKTGVQNILVFCRDPHEEGQDYAVRMFAHALGVPEDPATGSGNGCLAAYLLNRNSATTGELEFTVGQGYEMGRPSELHLKARRNGQSFSVFLGGEAREIATGNWIVAATK